jgi:hypothetical protein
MKVNDSVYREQEITNPVIIDLINSKPMQRLKKINQHGTVDIGITRFAHGVGVFLLLKKLGASAEEQISGLLHDVNHAAFSHVIDFVYDRRNHDYTEQFHKQIIINSEIPSILKKAGFDVHRVADHDNFHLLERSIPDLCADRLDYLFRDSFHIGYITREEVQKFVNALAIFEHQIVVNNKENARKIGDLYLKTCDTLWATPRAAGSFQFFADTLKLALELKIITEKDFFLTDEELMNKLKAAKDEKIQEMLDYKWESFNEGTKENHDIFVYSKARYIDPLFLENGILKRLSAHDENYKKTMNDLIIKINKGFFVKIKKN